RNTRNTSKFTYGPKQTSADESDSKSVEDVSRDSDSSVKPSTSVPEPVVNESKVVNEPKAVNEPKVWTDAPIIEEYESDSDDDLVKGSGYAKKSCFVCGSFSHLIRDCYFHEKRMAKQAALIKSKGKGTGQQADRPLWNNVQRINHQN
nr:hypothetical protein [Tanacetum cinerariifolium]